MKPVSSQLSRSLLLTNSWVRATTGIYQNHGRTTLQSPNRMLVVGGRGYDKYIKTMFLGHICTGTTI